VPIAVSGLGAGDNGTVSFSDGSHAPVVVEIVDGKLASRHVNLAGLNDGPIAITLHLNPDASNTEPTDVVSTATLDQDLGEQAALNVAVNGGSRSARRSRGQCRLRWRASSPTTVAP
jgi:hypothetical protein